MSGGSSSSSSPQTELVVASPMSIVKNRPSPWFDADTLAEWMLEVSDPGLGGSSQAVCFSLAHVGEGGGLDAQTQVPIDKKLIGEARAQRVDKIVARFERVASTVAACFPVKQRFVVGAHLKLAPNEPAIEQTMFLLAPDKEAAELYDWSDERGVAGLVGNVQRMLSDALRERRHDQDRLGEWNKYLLEKMETALDRREELVIKLENALDARALREVHVEGAKLDLTIKHKLYDALADMGINVGKGWLEHKLLSGMETGKGRKNGKSNGSNGASGAAGGNGTSNGHPSASSSSSSSAAAVSPDVPEAAKDAAAGVLLELEPEPVVAFLKSLPPEKQNAFVPMLEAIHARMPPEQQERLVLLIRANTPDPDEAEPST